jgi:hypothetical protein
MMRPDEGPRPARDSIVPYYPINSLVIAGPRRRLRS